MPGAQILHLKDVLMMGKVNDKTGSGRKPPEPGLIIVTLFSWY
jgi:hypothetical protein